MCFKTLSEKVLGIAATDGIRIAHRRVMGWIDDMITTSRIAQRRGLPASAALDHTQIETLAVLRDVVIAAVNLRRHHRSDIAALNSPFARQFELAINTYEALDRKSGPTMTVH